MMKKFWNISLVIMLVLSVFTGCAKDDDKNDEPDINANFQLLIDYLEAAGGNYLTANAPRVVSAVTVNTNLQTDPDYYTILDVRTADKYGPGTQGSNGVLDFDEGHIEGAVNVATADVVTYCADNSVTGPILVTCYTGHDAGYAVAALNLMGYEAYSLGFGMSGWHTDFDLMSGNIGSAHGGSFVTDAAPALPADGSSPVINTTLETGEAILAEQVDAVLTTGFAGVSATTVIDNPDDYFIVNYFSEDDYLGLGACPAGHIDGAYQYTPNLSLQTAEDIYTLPTDQTIAVYCWTGQHGSQTTFFLNLLGYDAVDVKFGVNAMVHDQLTGHVWDATTVPNLAYVETVPQQTEFEILIEHLEGGDNWVNDMTGWIVDYYAGIENDYFLLDIRSANDFNDVNNEYDLDHLPNAVNASLTTMLSAVDGQTGPILVICYSGHSAAYTHMLLRLLGYEAYSMKWGMSIVAAEHDRWTGNVSNDYAADPNWSHDPAPALPTYGYPTLTTGFANGADILALKVGDAIEMGFVGITAATVMADPTSYNIANYWALTDYDNYGHIAGALQVTPATLTMAENLSAFSPDMENVIYCWTGQTGAAVAAYLTVLGYDIADLKFGTNAMIFDELTSHKWPLPW
ncbi:MAG: hypothetical protein ISR91_01450 [Candidatus Delongbacteria bacterium]|nr:hypothetical protein [Candidatus Delongbacteria bacterium]